MLLRLRRYLARPVAWGAVLLSYAGIIAAVSYAAATGAGNADAVRGESHRADQRIERVIQDTKRDGVKREEQLCLVVINVHDNAKLRARSEQDELQNSRRIYRLSNPNNPIHKVLKDRVDTAEQRRRIAVKNVRATRVPPVCQRYERNN